MTTQDKELPQGALLGHFACPHCSSNNNLAVYVKTDAEGIEKLDGSCFTPDCKRFWSEADLREAGVLEEGFVTPKVKPVTKTPITAAEYKALIARCSHDTTMADGSAYRGIKTDTAKFYGHLFERNAANEIIKVYYPETKFDFRGECKSLRGYKTRVLPKQFGMGNIGLTGLSNDFSGQHLFPNGGKWVVIVGGEEDKLAASQMHRDYQIQRGQEDYDRLAVVSTTAGEATLARSCAAQYDWLDSFDEIILCMDNDDAGKKAVVEAIKVLPEGKVKVMTTSLKDANQMLLEKKQKQFISNFYDAKSVVPDDIKTSKQADDEVEEELGRAKIPLPPFMRRLQKLLAGGIPLGYIVNLGAITGGGKTTIINEMIYYWIFNSPVKIGILSLELTAGQYQAALLSRHIGYKLALIEDPKEAVAFVQQPHIKAARKVLRENEFGEERYVLLDERSGSLEAVKAQILKLIKKYGCQLIIIDPVNDLFEGSSLDQQTDFIKFLKGIIKEGVSVFNVCHLTKGKTQTDRDGKRIVRQITEDDFSGVSNLVKSGGCNIAATRDKLAEEADDKNTTDIEVLKCRWTGNTGYAGSWYYENETHTLYDKMDFFANKEGAF